MKLDALETRFGRTWLLIICGSLVSFAPVAFDMVLPAFPQMAEALGVSVDEVQLTLSAALLGMGLGQGIYGPLSDRFGRRVPLIVGLCIFIAASIGCALAPSFGVLVALRFVQSLGGAAGMVLGRAIVRDRYSGVHLAKAMSSLTTVFALAPILAPVLGAAILAFASWQWMFIAMAAFGAYALIAVLTLPETLDQSRRNNHGLAAAAKAYVTIAMSPAYRIAGVITGLTTFCLFAFIAASPAVFMETYGVSDFGFAIIFGVNAAFLVVGAQINIRLLKRFSVHSLIRGSLLVLFACGAVMTLAALLHWSMFVIIVALAIATSSVGANMGNATSEVLKHFPNNAASASALIGVLQMCLGAAISTILGSLVFSPPVEMSVAILIGAGLALVLATRLGRIDTMPRITA
jgi:DHA1 family bicyclomycin/chloramphenicol resistance-like MFS transporter